MINDAKHPNIENPTIANDGQKKKQGRPAKGHHWDPRMATTYPSSKSKKRHFPKVMRNITQKRYGRRESNNERPKEEWSTSAQVAIGTQE
jgi:hypothetical protein